MTTVEAANWLDQLGQDIARADANSLRLPRAGCRSDRRADGCRMRGMCGLRVSRYPYQRRTPNISLPVLYLVSTCPRPVLYPLFTCSYMFSTRAYVGSSHEQLNIAAQHQPKAQMSSTSVTRRNTHLQNDGKWPRWMPYKLVCWGACEGSRHQ